MAVAAIRKSDGPNIGPRVALISDVERLDSIHEEITQLCAEARAIQARHPNLMYLEEDYSAPRYENG